MALSEFATTRQIVALLRRISIHPGYFLIPVALSFGAASFEGVGMGLLIPILGGFLTKDYSFIKDIPGLGTVISLFPESLTERDRMLFVVLLTLFISVILFKNILRYTASVSMSYLGTRTVHNLRKQVFARYLTFGKLYFDRTTVGHHATLLSHFTTEALQPLLNVDRAISALFSLLAYTVVMTFISWKLTAFAVPLFLLLHYAVRRMIGNIRSISRLNTERSATLGKNVIEIISAMPLVKASNTEEEEHVRYTSVSNEKARLEFRMNVLQQLIGPLQEVITLFAVLLLISAMLYLLVREGGTAAPSFLVYFYLVINATNKFGVLTGFRSNLANAAGPIAEVMAVFEGQDKHAVQDGPKVFTGLEHAISVRNLTFSYIGGRTVLSNLSFTIQKGRVTAIVGPTGAGKTTLISLLLRYYDCPPGTIFFDDTDVRELTSASVRAHMALVSQETFLFHDTLRRNIAYGLEHVSDEELQKVIERARLTDFVRQLPQGLDTLIGDRGVKLSGGEKQRVSIARALLRGAQILILDEATSSLDVHTERLIQEAIEEAIRGKTVIVIAHRLSTIRRAERIVVIEGGRCVEEGSFHELQKHQGAFFRSWQEQELSSSKHI